MDGLLIFNKMTILNRKIFYWGFGWKTAQMLAPVLAQRKKDQRQKPQVLSLLVGARGFEPPTPSSRTKVSDILRCLGLAVIMGIMEL